MSPLDLIYAIKYSSPETERIYTEGACYGFFRILKTAFPEAVAYYNSDHIITRIDEKYYDITGEVSRTGHLLVDLHYPNLENEKWTS